MNNGGEDAQLVGSLTSEPFSFPSTAQEVSFLPEPVWALIVKYRWELESSSGSKPKESHTCPQTALTNTELKIRTSPSYPPLLLKLEFEGLGSLQHLEINKRIKKHNLNRASV